MKMAKEEKKCCLGCDCGGCSCQCRNFVLRIVLGLIILTVVFWMGMKIGELKSEIKNSYRPMMWREWQVYPVEVPSKMVTPAATTTKR